MIELAYKTRRGGWMHRRDMTPAEIAERLPRLKTEAFVRKDGEIIGAVEDWSDQCDDRRLKWIWWFDADELK